jgi:glucosamine-6-phosphate deaminase
MQRSFVQPLEIADGCTIRLPLEGDLDDACAAFDRELDARGGLDLAILGLGANGHLGFNEPPSGPTAATRVVELAPVTVEANGRYWGGPQAVPTRAVTIGMRTLLAARAIVLVVSGASKRPIVHRMLEEQVGEDVPASFLRATDSDVTVVIDRAAWGDA